MKRWDSHNKSDMNLAATRSPGEKVAMGKGTDGKRLAWAWLGALILGGGSLLSSAVQAQTPSNPYSYSRTSSFSYFTSGPNKGLLQSETVEPDNPQLCVVTTYDYDAYGNRKSATTANCPGATGDALFDPRTSGSTFASQTVTVASVSVTIPAGQFATSSSNALNQGESREYDPRFGLVTKLTGPNGLTTLWTYDDLGRKLKELRADGTSTVYYYCLVGDSSSPLNSTECNSGNVTAAEAPADAYAYVHTEPRDKNGLKMGAFVRVYSDRAGRELRSVTESFDGNSQNKGVIVADTGYSATGMKQTVTAPYFKSSGSSTLTGSNDAGITETRYDALGRPTVVYMTFNADAGDPSPPMRSFGGTPVRGYSQQLMSYAGLKVITTNDKGQTRIEEKNANGEVIRVTDASGAQLLHQRDAFGNLVATKDPLGNTVSIDFDLRGRKVAMRDPDTGTSKYGYDALGQLVWQQNAKQVVAGTKTSMAYDKLGRLRVRTEAEYTTTWVYDSCSTGVGKLCSVSTTRGITRTMVYDALGRPKSSSTQISTGSGFSSGNSFTSLVDYDPNTGRLSTQTYPSGLQLAYAYTERGFLNSVSYNNSVDATIKPLPDAKNAKAVEQTLKKGNALWTAKAVNAWGKLEQQQYGNGVMGTAAFDSATGRITDLKAGASNYILNQHYGWDSLGQLTKRIDSNGDTSNNGVSTGAVSETFAYGDSLNRLTSYTVSAPAIPGLSRTVNLQYNALGMLLSKSDVGNYAYNAQGGVRPHALKTVTTAQGTTSYGYDDNGNLVSADGGKYTSVSYTSFNLPDSGQGLQGPAGKYAWQYDENHARILETHVTAEGTRQTWYLHPDNQGGLGFESEIAPNGAISNRHYISAGGQTIAVLVSTGALPANPATTAPTVFVKLEYWHKDHLGSLVSTSDHTGALTARYAYDPFGKRRYLNGSYDEFGTVVADWSATVNYGTDRGFTGHEHLDDLGIVHMNGRLFDPRLGVFLQADPMLQDPYNLQNYNRYAYCYNNPLGCVDPSGYFSLKRFLGSFIVDLFAPGLGTLIRLNEIAHSKVGYQIGSIVIAMGCASSGMPVMCNGVGQSLWSAMAGNNIESSIRTGVFAAGTTWVNGQIGDAFKVGADGTGWVQNSMAHAAWGCAESSMQGGSCRSGALSGGLSAAWSNMGFRYGDPQKYVGDLVVNTMAHAAVGGAVSVASGGDFWVGARSAAFSYLYNYCGKGHGNDCFKSFKETLSDSAVGQFWYSVFGQDRMPAPTPTQVSLTGGGTVMVGPIGMSQEYGAARATDSPQACFVYSKCVLFGLGLGGSVDANVSFSEGSPGDGWQVSTFGKAALPVMGGEASLSYGSDGFGIGAGWSKGLFVGGGLKVCQQICDKKILIGGDGK